MVSNLIFMMLPCYLFHISYIHKKLEKHQYNLYKLSDFEIIYFFHKHVDLIHSLFIENKLRLKNTEFYER